MDIEKKTNKEDEDGNVQRAIAELMARPQSNLFTQKNPVSSTFVNVKHVGCILFGSINLERNHQI